MSGLSDRDEEIADLVEMSDTMSLEDIGNRYGITGERVRQIAAKYGVKRRPLGMCVKGETNPAHEQKLKTIRYLAKKRYELKRQNGECYSCANKAAPGRRRCEKHLIKHANSNSRAYKAQKLT